MNGGFLTDNELAALERTVHFMRYYAGGSQAARDCHALQRVVDRHRALVLQSHAPANHGTTGGRAETAPEDHPRSSGAEQRRWVTP